MRDVNYRLAAALHACGWRVDVLHRRLHPHLPRPLLRLLQGAARGLFGSWRVIFLLMMATAFMGYVLPWGQMSFWGATVITNLFSVFPIVGETVVIWLWGGFAVDNPTLNRFFSLHYLLPFMIFGVVILHVWALHTTGQTTTRQASSRSRNRTRCRSHPYATVKDLFAMVCS
jgi:ubiquinol-cytochrome c reductase cytochrome b/c1 subunit